MILCRIRGPQLGSHSLGDGYAFGTRSGLVLKRSAGTSENPGALCDGIRAINCENSRKVVTGSRIVSPGAIVRKSNMPALSKKVLSPVWCRLLRKFVGSVTSGANNPTLGRPHSN